jgi:hypothetical protein
MPTKTTYQRELGVSTSLSRYYVHNFISPQDVIAVLAKAGIKFMLVGLHGVVGWVDEARATEDVDVLVGVRYQKRAVRILLEHFPQVEAEDHEVVTRLRDRDTKKVLIDVMKCNQPLYREAFKFSETAEAGVHNYLIPCLELALAMKFAPMISLTRADEDKFQDAHDFIRIVKCNPDIDLVKLHQLGELVYHGGGDEIVEKVRQVRAGEKLEL